MMSLASRPLFFAYSDRYRSQKDSRKQVQTIFFDMEKNISSKITYAAKLISRDDQSAGGYHYSSLNTIIYLLQWYESKHVGAEVNKLNLLLKVSHLEYGTEKPVYIYYGPEKSDSMDESILALLKKEVYPNNNEKNFDNRRVWRYRICYRMFVSI